MELSDGQRDTLVEILNVGFGRAAAALSRMTGYRVVLEPPAILICPLHDLADTLGGFMSGEVATVHQMFSGPVGGDALLVLDRHGAETLKQLLTDEPPLPLALDGSAREVLAEVGNILLNACLGTLSNLLEVRVSFSVPQISLDTLRVLLDSVLIEREELRYALVIHASFHLRDSEVKGYIVIVLTVQSLTRLLSAFPDSEEEV